ncbi:hypothetical protein X809_28870 [Paenibacillus polymyxa CR1]|nr:hypothetical protein X809_28870 [Paenibacillus polymyxa CR1]
MINDVQRKPSFYVCKVNWGTTGGDLHSSKYDLTTAWESSPSKKKGFKKGMLSIILSIIRQPPQRDHFALK